MCVSHYQAAVPVTGEAVKDGVVLSVPRGCWERHCFSFTVFAIHIHELHGCECDLTLAYAVSCTCHRGAGAATSIRLKREQCSGNDSPPRSAPAVTKGGILWEETGVDAVCSVHAHRAQAP